MNQKPLIIALVVMLIIVLAGFLYSGFSSRQGPLQVKDTVNVTPKVTLPPEQKSPRAVVITPVQVGSGSGAITQKIAKMERVSITASGFVPEMVNITPGDLVTWTNNDTVDHRVKGKGEWGGRLLTPGKIFTQEFDIAGTYSYFDQENPTFTGRVVVNP